MEYSLRTQQFSGPIEKLLELIEAQKLQITEINLASVTADFLDYLNTVESSHPRLLADFVVVAAKLLLIKSKALLPNLELTSDEEKEIHDLEEQLRFYQNFKPAMAHVKNFWENPFFSISRPLMANRPVVFYPSENTTIANLQKSIAGIFEALKQFSMETKTIKSPLITLEEKIQEIIGIFEKLAKNDLGSKKGGSTLKFRELKGNRPRQEIIVMFLALLHLLDRHIIQVKQNNQFSDIIIEKI